jgi:hypothetical protein
MAIFGPNLVRIDSNHPINYTDDASMNNKFHITEKSIKAYLDDNGLPDKEVRISDDEITGFGVRISKTGRQSFSYRYFSPLTGKRTVLTLGNATSVNTANHARTEAHNSAIRVALGECPATKQQQQQAELKAANQPKQKTPADMTIAEYCAEYFNPPRK